MDKFLKHAERLDHKKIRLLNLLSFLIGISGSSLIYVLSSYVDGLVGEENMSLIYSLAYLILFFLLLNFHKLINRFGEINLFLGLQFFKILILFFLGFLPLMNFNVALVIGYLVFSYITWVEMDIILEGFSADRMSGRIRGFYLTFNSLGYLVGPLISTQILEHFDYAGVFIFALILSMVFFLITLVSLNKTKSELREVPCVKKILQKIFSNSDLRRIYFVSVFLEIFYAVVVVYVPIYLLSLGVNWSEIGILISLAHLPFILLQYPIGALADKKMGEKEILILAFLILGFSTLLIYFIQSSDLFVWAMVLMTTRIGAALIEVLRDSYFYKKVDARDVDLINFFRTAGPVAFFLGTALASFCLLFFSTKAIFILFGMIIFLGIIPAARLRDNLSEKEIMLKNGIGKALGSEKQLETEKVKIGL